ncbi:hypothetical protein SDC9_157101 [bioreactor metagenome]|uniref:Uncharacterized protein n=1 Tax=bioreactor metagenome TaxID=1076179 RepID=A0A645F8Z7_9ZZZZ
MGMPVSPVVEWISNIGKHIKRGNHDTEDETDDYFDVPK